MVKKKKQKTGDFWERPQVLASTGLTLSLVLLFVVFGLYRKINAVEQKLKAVEAQGKVSEEKASVFQKQLNDVQKTLNEQLNLVETEIFRNEDLGKTVAVWPKPLGPSPENTNYVLIELDKIPFENTVAVVSQSSVIPPSAFDLYGNVVMISTSDPVESILKDDKQFIAVTYIPYTLAHQKLYTIQDARIISVVGNQIKFVFKFRE